MKNSVHVQAMSNYFAKIEEQKQNQVEELADFKTEVTANPEKFADAVISNIKKAQPKKGYAVGSPAFGEVTYTNQAETIEKQHGRDLLQMLYSIQGEAETVYRMHVNASHYSANAKEVADKAKLTYRNCEKAINKLKKVL